MHTNENTEYDFVIIGSGLGGLVSAFILADEGYKVIVLEKNHQIGGLLQVYSRDKTIFDTGVHYVGGLNEGENLNQFFKYLGIFDQKKNKKYKKINDYNQIQEYIKKNCAYDCRYFILKKIEE